MTGYRELLAVEWDAHAAEMFRRNFPDVKLHHGDIKNIDPSVLGLQPGELDVLDGSPPCQGFSMNGNRQLDDPRNQLFRQFVRLLRTWQPKAFVAENVAGMIIGPMRLLFAEILSEFKDVGYRVTARLIDASYLGVPQIRKRMIFIGVRADLGIAPVHPVPMSRRLTVRQAWDDLSEPGPIRPLRPSRAAVVPLIQPGATGAHALKQRGGKPSLFSCVRLHWDKPSRTIVKDSGTEYLHPRENRSIGVNELTRLQSFPDEYDWGASTYGQIQARLGNSVPPLMMRAVAAEVRNRILEAADGA
jgi:DNA (cytosine-5)-methyltransferase 1